MLVRKGADLKAVKIEKVFFKDDKTLFPLKKTEMKYQIHYSTEKNGQKVEVKDKTKIKKKGK